MSVHIEAVAAECAYAETHPVGTWIGEDATTTRLAVSIGSMDSRMVIEGSPDDLRLLFARALVQLDDADSTPDHLGGLGYEVVHHFEHPEGLVQAATGGTVVARLVYHVNEDFFPEPAIAADSLSTDPQHRRQGLAKAMYAAVLAAHPGLNVTHLAEALSDDAKLALARIAAAQPGRHMLYDDKFKVYIDYPTSSTDRLSA